ncbi:MAG: hypothetical protein ACOC8K_08630 [Gemmatimonadota bacterium]
MTLPILFAPRPAQAESSSCGGYDTVECSVLEWCFGPKELGLGVCVSNHSYYPPVTVHVSEALDDQMDVDLWEGMGDYVHDGSGTGGGGTF